MARPAHRGYTYFDRIAARIAGVDPPPEASKPIPAVFKVGSAIGDE